LHILPVKQTIGVLLRGPEVLYIIAFAALYYGDAAITRIRVLFWYLVSLKKRFLEMSDKGKSTEVTSHFIWKLKMMSDDT